MKYLQTPAYNDVELLQQASTNQQLSSYPHLRDELPSIIRAYNDYEHKSGNALSIEKIVISDDLKNALKTHYRTEPQNFNFISTLRESSRSVCPMCGSLGTGTLDHILPQAHYPEFSVYSKNLVPACSCNIKRKDCYKGVNNSLEEVRVLHPYYDAIMSERILSFNIVPSPSFPIVKFELYYLISDEETLPSIHFHVEKIIIPSGILKEMANKWASLSEYPSDTIHTLPQNSIIDIDGLNNALADALGRHDRQKGTKNNWESIFIHSILSSDGAKEWIVRKHNEIVTRQNT